MKAIQPPARFCILRFSRQLRPGAVQLIWRRPDLSIISAKNFSSAPTAPPTLHVLRAAKSRLTSPNSSRKLQEQCRAVFEHALNRGEPVVKRYAAIFIAKSALRLADIDRAMKLPWVQQAVHHLETLIENQDLFALTIYAQIVDRSKSLTMDPSSLWAQVETLVLKGQNVNPFADIMGLGDVCFALAIAYQRSVSRTNKDKALNLLRTAVFEHHHIEACLRLVALLDQNTHAYHDCLLRLALSGHFEAAGALGHLYSLPDAEFAALDQQVRHTINGRGSFSSLGSSIPPHLIRQSTSDQGQLSAYLHENLLDSSVAELGPVPSASGRHTRLQASLLVQNAWERIFQASTDHPNRRLVKALDWYRFAALGHYPAVLSGLKLASRLKLPVEMVFFESVLLKPINKSNAAQYLFIKNQGERYLRSPEYLKASEETLPAGSGMKEAIRNSLYAWTKPPRRSFWEWYQDKGKRQVGPV